MIRLIFHSGPLAGTEINTGAMTIRLGRDPAQNDLVVEDKLASGKHCTPSFSSRLGMQVIRLALPVRSP